MNSKGSKFGSNLIGFIPVLMGVFLYSLIYSYLSIAKFNTFNATVADLGINANFLYQVFHGGISITPGSSHFINTGKLIYLVLAPFYNLYPSEKVLLVFQSVWVAFGAIPIYFIAKKRFGTSFVTYALSFSWLLYYPMAGVNWFDFHFMALFPTFFLLGQAFLESGNRRLSSVFFVLATITDFLIPVVMVVYGTLEIIKNMKKNEPPTNNRMWIFLIAVSLLILLTTNIIYGPKYTLDYLNPNGLAGTVFKVSPWRIIPYSIWILLPLSFISLLAPEYLLLLTPFFILAGISLYGPYLDTMFEQYASLTAPIVFLSAIMGMEKLDRSRLTKYRIPHLPRNAAKVMMALGICFSLLFTPAGNLLTEHYQNPRLSGAITGNVGTYDVYSVIHETNTDKAIWWMISLIPKGSSVMAQNNFPQLYQGYDFYWPSYVLENSSHFAFPQYAIVDQHNVFYNNTVFPGEKNSVTAENAFNTLYKTGKYGILAYYNGVELIEYNYTGNQLVFHT